MRTKMVAYIRCSTVGQATDGVSLEAQRAKILAWCIANGHKPPEVFVDAGISGKRADNRSGLQKALRAACKTRGTALVVYSLSRLARSTKDAIAIAERLDKAGADLVSLSEQIDTTTAAGKMVFRMLAVLAEFERDIVSERTRSAMAVKRSNGQRIGTLPYGFDLDNDGKTLVENAREQSIIGEIHALRAGGKTLKAIADELTDRGIATKTGNARWGHPAVRRILQRQPMPSPDGRPPVLEVKGIGAA